MYQKQIIVDCTLQTTPVSCNHQRAKTLQLCILCEDNPFEACAGSKLCLRWQWKSMIRSSFLSYEVDFEALKGIIWADIFE